MIQYRQGVMGTIIWIIDWTTIAPGYNSMDIWLKRAFMEINAGNLYGRNRPTGSGCTPADGGRLRQQSKALRAEGGVCKSDVRAGGNRVPAVVVGGHILRAVQAMDGAGRWRPRYHVCEGGRV